MVIGIAPFGSVRVLVKLMFKFFKAVLLAQGSCRKPDILIKFDRYAAFDWGLTWIVSNQFSTSTCVTLSGSFIACAHRRLYNDSMFWRLLAGIAEMIVLWDGVSKMLLLFNSEIQNTTVLSARLSALLNRGVIFRGK